MGSASTDAGVPHAGAVAGDRNVVGDSCSQVGVGDDAGALFAAVTKGSPPSIHGSGCSVWKPLSEELLEQT